MPWAKIDDQFYDHPKVVAAGPVAIALFVCGLSYCNRHLTDGFISEAQVKKLSDAENPLEIANKLVLVGLWENCTGGYMVHDYLDYNMSAAQIKADREANAKRQEEWRAKRGISNTVSNTATNDVANDDSNTLPSPSPSPSPSPNSQNTSGAKNAPGEQPHKRTERQEALATLENEFSTITSIPLPRRATDRQKMSASTGWWQPLGAIWELENKDVEKALILVRSAIAKMRRDSLTIAAPRSILNVARSIHGNGKSAEHAEQPSKVYR